MTWRIFGESEAFKFGPVPVTDTMLTSLAVSVFLVALATWMRRTVQQRPDSGVAAIATLAVESLDRLVSDIIGRVDPRVVALAGGLFAFIVTCNLVGQVPGIHPPTASLATTTALAIVVFLAVPALGIRARGLCAYLADYCRPNPLFLPLHVISEVSRTVALSVRLFGNILSGHLVVALLVALAGFLVPMPMMALDLLVGLLQAYIFTILATVYVGAALGAEEEP